MKKLILFLSVMMLIVACSSSDDDDYKDYDIQGQWKLKSVQYLIDTDNNDNLEAIVNILDSIAADSVFFSNNKIQYATYLGDDFSGTYARNRDIITVVTYDTQNLVETSSFTLKKDLRLYTTRDYTKYIKLNHPEIKISPVKVLISFKKYN